MTLSLTDKPSPNFDTREGGTIDMVVLHYTGMASGWEALNRLCDPASKVSAHYLVDTKGVIFQLVNEENRAWHAGRSHWAGQDLVNDFSIGIEIVNPGHWFGYEKFSDEQMKSVVALVTDICERHKISPLRVVGHSDVAPGRKEDPGELFPWAMLAKAGVAIAPYTGKAQMGTEEMDFEHCMTMLEAIGYKVERPNYAAPLLAFQRRFCPTALGKGFDPLTRSALKHIHSVVTKS